MNLMRPSHPPYGYVFSTLMQTSQFWDDMGVRDVRGFKLHHHFFIRGVLVSFPFFHNENIVNFKCGEGILCFNYLMP